MARFCDTSVIIRPTQLGSAQGRVRGSSAGLMQLAARPRHSSFACRIQVSPSGQFEKRALQSIREIRICLPEFAQQLGGCHPEGSPELGWR